MEKEFSQRLVHRLRAVVRGSTGQLFDGDAGDGLLHLGGRIVDLRNTLKAEQTKVGLVAKHYLLAYLGEKHGPAAAKRSIAPRQMARTWLASLSDADT